MRTNTRLLRMKEWLYKELCQGRQYKTPSPDDAITNTKTAEPMVFLGWQPLWSAMQAQTCSPHYAMRNDPFSVCPAITVMPGTMPLNKVPEKRFDRYNKINRAGSMGSSLTLTILFSIYEPGIRLPGFEESLNSGKGLDKNLMLDATEEGLLTLMDWMDDAVELMLRERIVPGTDLVLDEESAIRSLFTDQNFVVDRRPIFYGFLVVDFKGHADKGTEDGAKSRIDRLLDDGDDMPQAEYNALMKGRAVTGAAKREEGLDTTQFIIDE